GSLTLVAAICVLGDEIALATAYQTAVNLFCVAAGVLWAAIIYAFFIRATVRSQKPDRETAIDGSWLLVVVATQGLAILTTHTSRTLVSPETALFAALCLFLLGAAFYAVLITLIVARWIFLPLRPKQFIPPY